MPGVQVTFGANIQPLVDGVESAESAIHSFMAAFAVDKLESFIEADAKLGDQIEATARQFGESTTQVQQIGYVAKMAGGDQQSLANSLGRLQLELQQAQNPTTRQAQALAALGLSTKQLIGLPLPQQLGIIADAFAKYADGPNKAAVAQALFRNSSDELISILDGGRAGLEAFYKQAEATGALLSGQTVAALAATDRATVALKASMSALGATIVAAVSSSLIAGANNLTAFIAAEKLAIESGMFWQRQLEGVEYALASMALSVAHAAQLLGDLFKLSSAASAMDWSAFKVNWAAIQADWAKGEKEQEALLQQHYARLKAIADQGKEKLSAEQTSPTESDKPQMPAMATNAQEQLAEQKSAIAEQIKSVDDYFNSTKEKLSAELAQHRITYDEETAALIAAIQQRDASEQTWYASEVALVKAAGKNFEDIERQKDAAHDKALLEIQKATDAATKEEIKQWKAAADQIASAINGQLKQILSGHETLKQGLMNISGQIALKFIQDQVKVTVEFLAESARRLATWIASETGMTTATTTGAALRAAAQTASGQTSILETLANALKAIFASGGQTAAEVTAAVAPTTGPAAPAIGLAAGTTTVAGALGIAQMAVGGYVLREGLIYAHPGEVVPAAKVNMPYHGNGTGGGGISRGDLSGMLSEHREGMGQMLAAHQSAISGLQTELANFRRRVR
jgi:hypothetical protein